ncbi:MAG: hypothetical protein V4463_05550 [Pseudomonadota bacterium]
MKLIAEKLSKSDKLDRLTYERVDGSRCTISMPRQGILPHDLVHYLVEKQLGLRHGFTGIVAGGGDANFTMGQTHDPANKLLQAEAVQVEAIVEALQTQLWCGSFTEEDFLEGARSAAEVRGKPAFDFGGRDLEALLYLPAQKLGAEWSAIPFYGSMTLEF